jgi:HEAT repeat protein
VGVEHAETGAAEGAARRRAVALAGHTGDADTARAALADSDPVVRATALGALARAGALQADDLARAVADPSAVVRQRAAEVSVRVTSEVRVPIVGLLEDPDPSVVEVAAWAAGELDPPEPGAVDELVRLAVDHGDPLVRESAVAALGSIGDVGGLPAILAATGDKPAVRRRAVLALAPFEGPDVDAALRDALTDRDWQVRQAAEDLLSDE